jgi:hypothetical protein
MSGKYALIIGNTEYIDPGLAQLTAPGKDAEDFARVLQDKDLCAFDEVRVLLNQLSSSVIETVDEFFDQKKPDDMLVLYFSGHGVRDEMGLLYLGVKNTIRTRLRSTAIRSDYIREAMDQSRSKRQILILDCCNSGAFPQGTKAEVGGAMGMTKAFQGYGRFVLTASDATQFAWEGDKVIGQTDNSLFTHFLVKGLEGDADGDGDGKITVDELYDYAYDQISRVTPKQTPTKSASKQEGEIILRQITRIEDIKRISLPEELIEATEDSRTFVREGAVQQLEKLLKGKNLGLVRSAREALERIEKEDDSRRVSQAAAQALEPIRQAEKADEERKAREEAEEERITLEKAEAKRKVKEEAERLLAEQKAEEEQKEQAEEERIAKQKAEEERLAIKKAETDRRAKEEAKRLLAERKVEEERIAKVKIEAERLAEENKPVQKVPVESKAKELQPQPSKFRLKTIGIWGVAIITVMVCGCAIMRYLPVLLGPLLTETPISSPAATQSLFTPTTPPEPPIASSAPTDSIPLSTSTPNKTSTPQTQRFFTEEFNSSLSSDWSVLTVTGSAAADPDKVTVKSQNGKLVWDFDSEYVYYYLFYDVFQYKDVKVDVRANNLGRNNNNISLMCRYDPNVGWYEFNIANNGLYDIYFAEVASSGDISYTRITNGGSNAIKQGQAVNDYSISCKGDELSLNINGDEVTTITEETYALQEGQIGISVSSFNILPILIEMDWVKIREP